MQTPESRLMEGLLGTIRTQAVKTALDLGLPALLADGPRTAASLAAGTGSDPAATTRLLAVLTSAGILHAAPVTGGDTHYSLTAAGRCLRPGAEGGLAEYAAFLAGDALPAAAHLTESVRTGRGGLAHELTRGAPFFRHIAEDEEAAARFDAAMAVSVSGFHEGVLGRDWRRVAGVTDVGGGTGELLTELLVRHPHLTGTLAEQERILETARGTPARAGVADRLRLHACDFFTEVPAGADVYLLVRILHDWDDTRAGRILRSVRTAMHPDSRLLVADLVLPDAGEGTRDDAWLTEYDLCINLLVPGHERTRRQWHTLLTGCGFHIEEITAAGWRGSVLECAPAPFPAAA